MPLYPQSAVSQGTRPNSFSFRCWPLDSQLSPSKSLRVCHLSKKIAIEVQVGFYGAFIVLIAWIYTNWWIWFKPCINLFSFCPYTNCSILGYFHCILIIVPNVNIHWNTKALRLPWLDHLLTNWGIQMRRYFTFYAPKYWNKFYLKFFVYRFCYKLNAIANYFQFYYWYVHKIRCMQVKVKNMLLDKFLSFPCYLQLAQWAL